MRGRYTLTTKDFTKHYGVEQGTLEFGPSYNIAPTQAVPVVLELSGERTVTPARWGLIPSWIPLAKSVTPSAERSAMSASELWAPYKTSQQAAEN